MSRSAAPVLIMAGGTGGHVFPGLAVARQLQDWGVPVVWLGTHAGLEARVVPAAGIPLEFLNIRGLRGNGTLRWVLAPAVIARAVAQAVVVLRRHRPRSVLGMGGYAAGPGGVAAWLLRKPLYLHEQNAVPGFTNRLLSRLARLVMTGFPVSFPNARQTEATGNPVRAALFETEAPERRLAGRTGPLRILVVGGSLGAQVLNQVVPQALASVSPRLSFEIRHQAGTKTLETAEDAYRRYGVPVALEVFIEDMAEAYGWADLVISRAGALTVAELAAVGVASCLVPLPYAVDDHQTANARYLADAGAAVLLPQAELDAERLAALILELGNDRDRLRTMAARARELARPEATHRVAERCMEAA